MIAFCNGQKQIFSAKFAIALKKLMVLNLMCNTLEQSACSYLDNKYGFLKFDVFTLKTGCHRICS